MSRSFLAWLIVFLSLLVASHPVDPHRTENHQSDNDLLDETGHTVHVQTVAKHTNHKCTDGRAGYRSHTAHQRRPADDRTRNGVEFIHDAFVWLSRHESRH